MRRDERGASAVEYGLLVALVVGVFVLAAWALGVIMDDVFTHHACDEKNGYECTE